MNAIRYMAVLAVLAMLAACDTPPTRAQFAHFTPAPLTPPGEVQYCFDGSPAIPDTQPFVFGGRDLSLPKTPEVAAAYKRLGVVWAGNGCVHDDNGYSANGPHVAFGGKCLDPPPPGTREYNDLIMGVGVTNWLWHR